MKTAILILLSCAVTLTTALGQDWAKARLDNSPRHIEWIKIKHGDREVSCSVAYPEVRDKATAVVVIHEIFGLTDWVRGVTDQLAEHGYIAIAPDFLTGTAGAKGNDAARGAIGSLPPEQVLADIKAAVDYAAKLPACNGKVVVAGFCWGGRQSFRFATEHSDIKAAFVFYGDPPAEAAIAGIRCPVYGFYGGNDSRITATVPQTTDQMKRVGKTYKPVIYEGAGHGFMRSGEAPDAKRLDKRAHDESWKRWLELLQKI